MSASLRAFRAAVALRRGASHTQRQAISFRSGPAPPRLPESEQKVFEDLQRRSTGAFSTPAEPSTPSPSSSTTRPAVRQADEAEEKPLNARVTAEGSGEELHPDVRRGARPEFQGERNPNTGEVGGPKNEPLRWGGNADWSFNGRVTDF